MPKNDKPYVNPLLEETFGGAPKRKKIIKRGSGITHSSSKTALRQPLNAPNPNTTTQKANRVKIAIIASIVIICGLAASPFPDFVSVISSEASVTPAIKDIGQHSGFSLKGKLLFYRANPELVNADSLNSVCPNADETIIEFGCYLPSQNKIYILEVPDAKYKEVEYTTAAHETLHEAWHKLDDTKRGEVAEIIKQFYDNKANPNAAKLTEQLSSYGKDEGVVLNELHSFIGSEYNAAEISQPLSDYYTRYFSDQSKPGAANNGFNAAISAESTSLDSQYSQVEATGANADTYKSQHLDNIEAAMNKAEYYGDTYTYNRNVDAYNQNLVYYNNQVDQFNSQRDAYNKEVDKFNSVLKAFYPTQAQVKLFPQ